MKLSDHLASIINQLRAADIDNPPLDARLLAGHALGLDRAALLSQSHRVLTVQEIAAIETLIARRAAHESVGRIIGYREFWGLNFALNEATLEPRPDSETVIEAVIKTVAATAKKPRRILDLGTGSGCLLLALLHEFPDATGVGIDIAPRAVEQARANAAALGINSRAEFCTGDWLDGVAEQFDIIVSNPPYIPASDIPALMRDVRDHDPMLALDGGADGLDPYRLMIPRLADFLNQYGIVAFEVGQGQAAQVAALLRRYAFAEVTTYKDLGGIERCVIASRAA